jgi:PAS domain S-box-containing protein
MKATGDVMLGQRVTGWVRRISRASLRRARGAERLRSDQSEVWFRRLAEASLQAILIHDGRRRLYCNAAYAQLLGYPNEAAVRRAGPLGRLHLFPADLAMLEVVWRGIVGGGQAWSQKRIRLRRVDGEVLWIDMHLGAVDWHGKRAIMTIQTDITHQVEIATELQRSDARLRRLMEESLQAISIHDMERRLFVNQAYIRMLGHVDADAAMAQALLDHVPPEDLPNVAEEWWRVLNGEHAGLSRRSRRRRADGTFIWVDMIRSAVQWQGRPAIQVISINVTGEVEAQAQLRQNEADMRQVAKLEAIGRLAGGIAHDFNNLLGTVVGFARFLHEDLPPGSALRDYAGRIIKVGEHGTEIVRQLLAFTRTSDVERRVTDLRELIDESRELLRASLPSSTRLDFDTGPTALLASVNDAQILQILLNLCINANDALDGRPGTIAVSLARVDAEDRRVDVPPPSEDVAFATWGELADDCCHVRLTVTDDGAGISQATLSRVFEPFFTTKSRGRGTGLGLSVVHDIVRAYGGAYTVDSRLGHGTRFAIDLPMADRIAPAALPDTTPDRVRGSETILLVDDEASLAAVTSIGLERLGYSVVSFLDPAQALAAFQGDPMKWSAVVTDQIMPGMQGITLASRLREIRPDCPIILCTGTSGGVSEPDASAASAAACLLKPVAPHRIAATIRSLLDR